MKAELKKCTINDICEIKSGKRIPLGCSFVDIKTPYPYIRARDIKDGCINTENLIYLTEDVQKKIEKYIINTNDIAITVVGASIGDIGYAKEDVNNYNLTENAVRLTNFNIDVSSKFIFYQLLFKQDLMKKTAGGAAQPKLGIYKVKAIPITLPPLATQQKIAFILSAYDDLIENNRKQIKLLEEAAQRLYKEWFVDLRFPGYENVAIVDGVPDGWQKGTLGEIGEFKRGKTITKTQAGKGNIPVVAGGIEPAYYTDKSNTSAPVITISASGNAGFVKIYFSQIWASDCSFLDMETNENLYYIYSFLKANQTYIYSLQKGACQQHVYAKDINAIELIIPNINIICDYVNTITPYFEKIEALQKQIQVLQQARDKLLPRLMSGEMEV